MVIRFVQKQDFKLAHFAHTHPVTGQFPAP